MLRQPCADAPVRLVLFAARLQDYSHRLQRLVSIQPAQFCKSGDMFQMRLRLPQVNSVASFNQPRIVEVTSDDIGLARPGPPVSRGACQPTDRQAQDWMNLPQLGSGPGRWGADRAEGAQSARPGGHALKKLRLLLELRG